MSAGVRDLVAVVTGAARGLGQAVAARLCSDGARVVAVDVDAQALAEGIPQASERHVVDVRSDADVRAFVARIAVGAPVLLVNCAGITADAMVHKMTAEQYRRCLDINLAGSHRMTEALLPGMRAARFGRVVHISSRAFLGNVGQANYAASKGGVVGMTRAQAMRFGPFGVTVNAIAPGLIRTRLTDAIPADIRQKFIDAIPVGRIGEPEDIAASVRYLCDREAGFVNGQTLLVCGGRSVGGSIR